MKKNWLKIGALAVIFFTLDIASKYYAIQILDGNSFDFLSGFLHFSLHQNHGVAFGIPIPKPLIFLLNFILLLALSFFFNKELDLNKKLSVLIVSMIIGGALANILDRIVNGGVTDFIGVYIWPFFNLADSFIVVGILLLLLFHARINRVNHSYERRKSGSQSS